MDALDRAQARDSKFELLAAKGSNTVAVVGNVTGSEFELICLGSISDKTVTELQARADLSFIGVICELDGKVRAALAVPIGTNALRALAREYTAYMLRVKRSDA